jgi:hypothetical protein
MVNGFPELVYKDRKEDQLDLGPNGTSLDLLRAVYRNPDLPLHTRMRAAMACLKHEHPSLGITFQTTNETDFAKLLDERIARHQGKLIEHRPQTETKPMPIADRRFLRRV